MNKRVLSIQSHVCSGYVGNNVAVICLQANGYEVDTINTVSFSNHTGYGYWTGNTLTVEQFRIIVDGLDKNKLLNYNYVLTGYVSSVELLQEIYIFIQRLKTENPSIKYICDPVIGDNGKYYVSESVIKDYRNLILKLADIITPNQYEAEWLTEIPLKKEEHVDEVISKLHYLGPQTIIITSVFYSDLNIMKCYASSLLNNNNKIIEIPIKRLDFSFVGTGDACAALLLVALDVFNDFKVSIQIVMDKISSLLLKTIEKYQNLSKSTKYHESYKKELALIDSLDMLKLL